MVVRNSCSDVSNAENFTFLFGVVEVCFEIVLLIDCCGVVVDILILFSVTCNVGIVMFACWILFCEVELIIVGFVLVLF